MSETNDPDISWTPLLEAFLSNTGERCECLSVCHKEAHEYFGNLTAWIDIPSIIFNIVAGSLSIGSATIFGDSQMSSVGVGVISLTTAVIGGVNSYYGWGKRSQEHKYVGIGYAKLYRFLQVEMGLPREERMQPKRMLKYVYEEYDRLAEKAPVIPDRIKGRFRSRFGDVKNVSMPPELNGLEEIVIYSEQKDTEKSVAQTPGFVISNSDDK